jgi:hypothetical protein
MGYYLGGYYLIRQKPIDFGSQLHKTVFTCSNCINESLLDDWSYSWTTNNNSEIENIKIEYHLSDENIKAIRQWVDKAFNEKRIGWINIFNDLVTAKEFRDTFFSHFSDVLLIGVYFSEMEITDLLTDFKPREENYVQLGLYENLMNKIPEVESARETFIGFDIIGIEMDGSHHTFHCHDISAVLVEKFGLETNEFGLFKEIENVQSIAKYMNADENGYEPVPWFVCKEKLVKG